MNQLTPDVEVLVQKKLPHIKMTSSSPDCQPYSSWPQGEDLFEILDKYLKRTIINMFKEFKEKIHMSQESRDSQMSETGRLLSICKKNSIKRNTERKT